MSSSIFHSKFMCDKSISRLRTFRRSHRNGDSFVGGVLAGMSIFGWIRPAKGKMPEDLIKFDEGTGCKYILVAGLIKQADNLVELARVLDKDGVTYWSIASDYLCNKSEDTPDTIVLDDSDVLGYFLIPDFGDTIRV